MFYFGVFDIFFSLLTTAVPLDLVVHYGMRSSAMIYFMWSGLLLILGSAIAYREMKKVHQHSQLAKGIGFSLILVALMLSAKPGDFIKPSDLNLIASFLVPGLLIYSYNKKPVKRVSKQQVLELTDKTEKEPLAKVEPETIQLSDLTQEDQLILKLKAMQYTVHAKNNVEFINTLNASIITLIELERSNYTINSYLLNQMIKLADIYFDLDRKLVITEKSEQLIKKVMQSFEMIASALVEMYDRSFEEESYFIESEIKTLELKLKTEGLLPSEFTMNE